MNPAVPSLVAPSPESFNRLLREYQRGRADWGDREIVQFLYQEAEAIVSHFFRRELEPPAIAVEADRVTRRASYKLEDGLGLKHRITINSKYLHEPAWRVLVSLSHELIHLWQATVPGHKPSPKSGHYHNRIFRGKARAMGLYFDTKGRLTGIEDPFISYLCGRGFQVPRDVPSVDEQECLEGKSKLFKWECPQGCQNVRSGNSELDITCNLCGEKFRRV